MPRAGGEADKLGNRYETLWTTQILLGVAAGEFLSLAVEPHGEDGTGVEFVVRREGGVRGFHSVKRQRAAGEWSLSALRGTTGTASRNVFGDLVGKLAGDDRARCCFISSTGANELRELAERAGRRGTVSEFRVDLDSSSALRDRFARPLCEAPSPSRPRRLGDCS